MEAINTDFQHATTDTSDQCPALQTDAGFHASPLICYALKSFEAPLLKKSGDRSPNAQAARLAAFTLIEMLIVMILSVIVVGIAYMVYFQMDLFSKEYEKKTSLANEMLTLDQHLRFDSHQADDILTTENTFTFLHANQRILAQYESNPAGIRRTAHGISDMFNISLQKVDISPEGNAKILTVYLGTQEEQTDTLHYKITLPATARAPISP